MRQCAVPFIPNVRVRRGEEANEAARQLTAAIEKWASDGWTFSHLESITTLIDNGCLASMFGNATTVSSFQVAILKRDD